MLDAVAPSNRTLDAALPHMIDIDIDSLTSSASGLLRTTLDDLAPYKVQIKKSRINPLLGLSLSDHELKQCVKIRKSLALRPAWLCWSRTASYLTPIHDNKNNPRFIFDAVDKLTSSYSCIESSIPISPSSDYFMIYVLAE